MKEKPLSLTFPGPYLNLLAANSLLSLLGLHIGDMFIDSLISFFFFSLSMPSSEQQAMFNFPKQEPSSAC